MRAKPVMVASLALVVAACTGKPASGPTTSDMPSRGGRLVVALFADPGHLNPAITANFATHSAAAPVFNALLALDDEGNLAPDLAVRLPEVQDGGRVYRFILRRGVMWHDGRPFTSADVKFTFEQVLIKFHARTRAMAPALQTIEAPDESTIVFTFKRPYPALLSQLHLTEAAILPKHLYEGTDPTANPANVRPVGTGPFKFESYSRGTEIRYLRNPDYFRPGLPHLEGIVMRVIPDQATQVLALERGEVDYLQTPVSGPDLVRLRSNPKIKVLASRHDNATTVLSFNLDRSLFRDSRVRQGIARALDRRQLLERAAFGEGKTATAPISSGIPWAHAEEVIREFDRRTAEELLESSGWKKTGNGRVAQGVEAVSDGTPLSFELVYPTLLADWAELIRQQLGQVGVEVTLRALDIGAFSTVVFKNRGFDTCLFTQADFSDPEIGSRRLYHSSQIGPVPFSNSSGYSNPAVDSLFDEASKALDLGERGKLYRHAQEILVADTPYVWLVELTFSRPYLSSCRGFNAATALVSENTSCAR